MACCCRYICTRDEGWITLLPLSASMEEVCTRSNNSSPRPTENPATPSVQAGLSPSISNRRKLGVNDPTQPSLPPSVMGSYVAEKSRPSRLKLPRSKPLFRGFEAPNFSRIAILTVLCLITYPAFHILKLVAKDRSLFAVRSIVSVWCSGVGLALGSILLKIGVRHLEAASEFTLVGYRTFLRPSSCSLGHGDSHEPRRWWNESPRSG